MFKVVLLFLTLSGLQAAPVKGRRHLQKLPILQSHRGFQQHSEHAAIHQHDADSLRQGTEPSRRFIVDLNTGLVQDHIIEMERRHQPLDEVSADVPAQRNGAGWVRAGEPSTSRLLKGFRQGTEPSFQIPAGFRQGTEPSFQNPAGFRQGTEPSFQNPAGFRQGTENSIRIPDGFRQGTEPSVSLPESNQQQTRAKRSISGDLRVGVEPIPDGFRQGTEPFHRIPDGFKQGTEPFRSIPDGFRQGTEPFLRIPDGFKQGTEPFRSIPDGFRQGTEPFLRIPDGFKQGTEPFRSIPDGFRQGTEPFLRIPDGFKQGTEPFRSIPDGFRQGTEPFLRIPDGFKQGTEPFRSIPDGFRQGTEPFHRIPDNFRQGTEPFLRIPDGFRQGTEPSTSRIQKKAVACKGKIINGNCYQFNSKPLAFKDAQDKCKALAPNADLVSITSGDLHSRLVSLVTKEGKGYPVLTWLGAKVKNQQASWVDGSKWGYSDWMPNQTNTPTDKTVCVEMFKMDESWWTTADCKLKRASICSYRIAA
ncbi:uncharacterized protein KZ484_018885 [Pholidichthys leucotaenia]